MSAGTSCTIVGDVSDFELYNRGRRFFFLILSCTIVGDVSDRILLLTFQYGYEHFLEQVNLAEQLTSSDFGISTGLIDPNYWGNSKWYYVNVECGNTGMT